MASKRLKDFRASTAVGRRHRTLLRQRTNRISSAAMAPHVLVTGGAGFIGSHLVDAYLARGWRVSIVDDLSTGDRRNVDPRAELHVMDIRDAAGLVARLRPDLINHHAAQMDVRRSVSDPVFDAETNIVGSLR